MKMVFNLLTMFVIAVAIGGALRRPEAVARVFNAVSDFMATGYAAELGAIPRRSSGRSAGIRR